MTETIIVAYLSVVDRIIGRKLYTNGKGEWISILDCSKWTDEIQVRFLVGVTSDALMLDPALGRGALVTTTADRLHGVVRDIMRPASGYYPVEDLPPIGELMGL